MYYLTTISTPRVLICDCCVAAVAPPCLPLAPPCLPLAPPCLPPAASATGHMVSLWLCISTHLLSSRATTTHRERERERGERERERERERGRERERERERGRGRHTSPSNYLLQFDLTVVGQCSFPLHLFTVHLPHLTKPHPLRIT